MLECTDADGDGVPSIADVCSGGDDRFDADDDGVPDQCDDDRDGDGILDDDDMFPDDATEWRDLDADGVGDNSDGCPLQAGTSRLDRLGCTDSDGDGTSDPDGSWTVEDGADAFPDDPSESRDSDGDGVGDHADPLPNDPSEWSDNDDDGIGDLSDTDDDNDGVPIRKTISHSIDAHPRHGFGRNARFRCRILCAQRVLVVPHRSDRRR